MNPGAATPTAATGSPAASSCTISTNAVFSASLSPAGGGGPGSPGEALLELLPKRLVPPRHVGRVVDERLGRVDEPGGRDADGGDRLPCRELLHHLDDRGLQRVAVAGGGRSAGLPGDGAEIVDDTA